jgi:hypothetical protein
MVSGGGDGKAAGGWHNASSIGFLALVVWRVSGRALQLGFLLALF